MMWHHEKWDEQRRVLMDLEVMNSHHSPNIVEYYGSSIINVSPNIVEYYWSSIINVSPNIVEYYGHPLLMLVLIL